MCSSQVILLERFPCRTRIVSACSHRAREAVRGSIR
jgi:hypothetical protein